MKPYSEIKEKVIRRRRVSVPLYDWVSAMVIALVTLVLLFSLVFRPVGVDGDSMVSTLADRDRLIMMSVATDYKRGDIVVTNRFTGDPLVKRVIAVPGDSLNITEEGDVLLNGETLREPYVIGKTVLRDFSGALLIPDGYYFVMGDNREVSLDSRSAEVGLIPKGNVVGKVVFRIWPIEKFGLIRSRNEANEDE